MFRLSFFNSFIVIASDPYSYDSQMVHIYIYENYICGDANNDLIVNILDITYIISFLYKDGDAPIYPASADVNNSGVINILDITYLIGYLYKSGPPPFCE